MVQIKRVSETKKKEIEKTRQKDGITQSQVRILESLSGGALLTRNKISEKSGVATCTLCPMLGSADDDARMAAQGRVGRPSLLTLEYVSVLEINIDGLKETVYRVTETGLQVLKEMQGEQ